MQSAHQPWMSLRPHFITDFLLKSLLVIFAVTVVASYGYWLRIGLASDTLRNSQFMLPISAIVPFVLGWLINRKNPGHTIAFFLLVMGYSSAILIIVEGRGLFYEYLPARSYPLFNLIMLVLGHTMWLPATFIPVYLIPLYFPSGTLLSRRWRVVVIFILLNLASTIITVVWRPWPWPGYGIPDTRSFNGIAGSEAFFDALSTFLTYTLFVPAFPLIAAAVFLRYRRSQGVERTQMKWPLFAILCLIGVLILSLFFPALLYSDAQSGYLVIWGIALLFPISIGIAILRHGLWDIDLIINRTLVYASLTALIIGAYITVVGLFSALFHSQTSTLGGLVAAGMIAVLFQPLRARLQARVNRLLYGERDDPATVLTRLAHHLQTAESTSEILPSLVQIIARALKIPHVAIWLPGDVRRMEPVAVWGEAPENAQSVALTYQQETIGHLVVAPRGPREQFNRHEQELLTTIAALTSTTIRAIQLSDVMRRSRQRIVTAREEERRRIRRDLHDGLGPQLASQVLGLEAVSQLMPAEPERAQALLDSLKFQAEEAILDVRHLVYGLRPPALDDLGLLGALEQSASRYETGRLRFHLDVPANLAELPAAVETTVFRVSQEAMTNVVRHAEATLCIVRLFRVDGHLILQIRDNGRGLSPNHRAGVGLQAMKERAAELNGQITLESLPAGGTLVQARLPLEVTDA